MSSMPLCWKSSRAGTITDEIKACDANRVLQGSAKLNPSSCANNATSLSDQSYQKMCRDPVKFVCAKHAQGRIYTSKCEIDLVSPADAGQAPEYLEIKKKSEEATSSILTEERGPNNRNCPPAKTVDDCNFILKSNPEISAKIKAKILPLAYTPARLKKIADAFAQVKSTMLDLVQNSTKIPETNKYFILNKIKQTKLADPLGVDANEPCNQPGEVSPPTGIFNQVSSARGGGGTIHFCVGSIAAIDRLNENSLFLILGHELAHSIDPCTMDQTAIQMNAPNLSGDSSFPGIPACLHGGSGPQGCVNSVLNCNSAANSKAFCEEQLSHLPNGNRVECMKFVSLTNNCPWGKSEPNNESNDLSAFRNTGEPLEQMRESFSDFMGAQVTAQILKKREVLPTPLEKKDTLTALAAGYANLHGSCMSTNTTDVHPPGGLRLMKAVLINQDLGRLLCPGNHTKSCEGI